MISDANWTGGGVGNYQALAAIYRDVAGVPGQTAIKAIMLMLLEWNRAGLLIAIVLLLQLLVLLLRGAFIARQSFVLCSTNRGLPSSPHSVRPIAVPVSPTLRFK
jgi:hypothetical protein